MRLRRPGVMPLSVTGTKRPTFLLHAIGGTVHFLAPLARGLGHTRDVYGIPSEALISRAAEKRSIPEMATHYLETVRAIQPTGPYEFIGYSMGGLIAVEMANQLIRTDNSVALVAMIDTEAPGTSSEVLTFSGALTLLANLLGVPFEVRPSWPASDDELLRQFRVAAHGTGSAPLEAEHVRHLIDVYIANSAASARYQPISLDASLSCIYSSQGSARESINRWREIGAEMRRVEWLDGEHYQLIHGPQVAQVASILGQWLDSSTSKA